MRNVTGAVLVLCGAWLLWSGWAPRAQTLAERAAAGAALPRASSGGLSMGAFGAIVRPIVYLGLGYLALKSAVAYVLFDGGRMFSPFDLAGFWVLLAAYGGWLHLRTSHWQADLASPALGRAEPIGSADAERLTPHGSGPLRPRGANPGARDRAGPGGVAGSVGAQGEPPRRQSRAA